jgi:nucleotide-binding universal stress UspA family protein
MSRKVVVAVDATERSLDALALGRVLAQAPAAPLALVTVFPYPTLADPRDEERVRVREEARQILLELAEAEGVESADVEVIPGNRTARELQRVTEREATGLLVIGSTGRGPIRRLLPGTVGERLLTGSAAPLAIATRGYAGTGVTRLETVGVGFDGSEESRHALEAGRLLARSSGARLRVITVVEPMTFGAVATGRTGGASVNRLQRAELRSALDQALSEDAGEPPAEGRLLEGSAGEILATESADLDLLVTGARGYGPRAAVLMGTTTHTLMRRAACPGLILPRGTSLDLGGQ